MIIKFCLLIHRILILPDYTGTIITKIRWKHDTLNLASEQYAGFVHYLCRILCRILLCRILSIDDAGYAAGSDTELTPVLCRILLCRILSTDDAGYAAGSDTELTPVFDAGFDAGSVQTSMPENIYILPDNIY